MNSTPPWSKGSRKRSRSRNVFADIVEGTDALVLVVDLDFRLLAINRPGAKEFERVYGVRPQVGTSLLEGLQDRPEHEQAGAEDVGAGASRRTIQRKSKNLAIRNSIAVRMR